MSNCLGQTLECWKRHSERLMMGLKPTGGWMGTPGEGEPNTVGRAELMARVVAAESTRGNVVHVTDNEILKKRQDKGWPTPRLGQGSNPDLWWRCPQMRSVCAPWHSIDHRHQLRCVFDPSSPEDLSLPSRARHAHSFFVTSASRLACQRSVMLLTSCSASSAIVQRGVDDW